MRPGRGAAEPIETTELRIVDKDGNVRGIFGVVEHSQAVGLDLLDGDQNFTARVHAYKDGATSIVLRFKGENPTIVLSTRDDQAGIGVIDEDGRPAGTIGVGPGGRLVLDRSERRKDLGERGEGDG